MPTATKKATSGRASDKVKQFNEATKVKLPKRKLKRPPSPAIYTLGPCGQAWQETQLHNRVSKLQSIGASDAQVAALAPRHFYQLSKWARIALKELFRRERLAKKGGKT